jgi:MYXO-CTERM domain-containing protein
MAASFWSVVFRSPKVYRTMFCMAVTIGLVGICRADDPGDNDADDGFYSLQFSVPATLPEKSNPGGWGALVLTFDHQNGMEHAYFQFTPACPTYAPETSRSDPNADNPIMQLGPGGYGLGVTGTEITSPPYSKTYPYLGQEFGYFNVVVEYEKIDNVNPPMVTSAFWQSKPSKGTAFSVGDDLAIDVNGPTFPKAVPVPGVPNVPEPSPVVGALGMAAIGLIGLVWHRRRRSDRAAYRADC